MPILFIDKILNGISTPILDGRDVDKTIIIDPDPTTTLRKLANKAVIRSETLKIEFYDEDGIKKSEFDLKPQDLSQILSDISDLKDRADDTDDKIDAINSVTSDNAKAAKKAHDRADSAHKLASTAEGTSAANSTAIGEIKLKQSEHTGRIEGLETKQKTDRADIRSVEADVLATDGRIDDVDARIDGVDSEISGLKQKDLDIDNSIVAVNSRIDGIDTKIGQIDAKDEEQDGRITKVEEEINGGGNLGSFLRENTDISVNSISSNTGKFEFNENYFPPNSDIQSVEDRPHEFYFVFKNEEGNTDAFLISKDLVDSKGKPIISVKGDDDNSVVVNSQLFEILEDVSTNAENIEKKVNSDDFNTLSSTVGSNTSKISEVESTANNADTLSKANKTTLDGLVIPPDLSSEVSSNTSKISEVESTANNADTLSKENKETLNNLPSIPSLEDYAKLNTDVSFNNVSLNGKISGLQSGEDVDTNAANIGDVKNRINAIDLPPDLTNKVNEVESIAKDADTLSKSNKTTLDGLVIPPDLSTEVSNNTTKIEEVETTANNADALSKANQTAISNLPPTPNLDGYAKLDTSVSFTDVSSNSIKGSDVGNLNIINLGRISRNHTNDANSVTLDNGSNAYKSNSHIFLNNSNNELAAITENSLDMKSSVIVNLSSGGDNDDRAANIGDVKRIAGSEVDLSEYAKLDEVVQFSRVNIKNDFASDTENPYLWCDPANGNTVFGATGSIYFNRYDHEGVKSRWAIVDSNSRMTLDNATKVHRLMNHNTWSTNSSTDKAGFVRWDIESRIIIGAKQNVSFQVNGKDVFKVVENGIDFTGQGGNVAISHDNNIDVNVKGVTNVAFKDSGMKLLRDVDAHSQNINNMGDISFNSGYAIIGKSNHNLSMLNAKGVFSKESATNNAQSIEFTDTGIFLTGEKTYIRTHNGGTIMIADQSGFDFKTKPLKNVSDAENEIDVPNLGQVKTLIDGLGAGLKFESYLEHSTTSGKTVFENQGHPNCFVDFVAPSGGAGINFDASKQGQSVIVGVRNNSGGTGVVNTNVSFQGHVDQGINNAKIPVGYMFIGIFNSDLAKSYSMIVPFKNVQHGYSASAEDIDLENVAPNTLFLTGDQGILETHPTDEGVELRAIENYNVPKINEDLDELKEQNELGKSKKHYFLNESTVIVPWNNPDHQPVSEVHVLDSSEQINGLGLTVSDDFSGYYTGTYASAGSHSITASGLWTEQSYHNVFKNVESNKYLVFNVDNLKWQLLTSDIQPSHAVNAEATEIIDLGGRSQLPESFGDYAINLEIENVDSLDFIKAIISPDVDSDNKLLIYNFGSAKPSGYILVK